MSAKTYQIVFIFLSVYIISMPSNHCYAGISSYTDEDGVIHFVESPNQIPNKSDQPNKSRRNINNELKVGFYPEDNVETARNATVKIEVPGGGAAAGFFISQNGYILTNKHVVMGIKNEIKSKEERWEQENIANSKKRYQLSKAKDLLDKKEKWLKTQLDIIRKLAKQPGNEKLYHTRLAEYTIIKTQYDDEIREYRDRKRIYDEIKIQLDLRKAEINKMRSKAYERSGVDVYLVNGKQFYAWVKATSHEYDLALLKLSSNNITPCLKSANAYQMVTGEKVYSIGNPMNVGHSVSSGIISGIKRESRSGHIYIQTTAQMSPGSSGGPLIDQYGRVIGINTWKIIGGGAEGLNFAIPVDIALKEFQRYLR